MSLFIFEIAVSMYQACSRSSTQSINPSVSPLIGQMFIQDYLSQIPTNKPYIYYLFLLFFKFISFGLAQDNMAFVTYFCDRTELDQISIFFLRKGKEIVPANTRHPMTQIEICKFAQRSWFAPDMFSFLYVPSDRLKCILYIHSKYVSVSQC